MLSIFHRLLCFVPNESQGKVVCCLLYLLDDFLHSITSLLVPIESQGKVVYMPTLSTSRKGMNVYFTYLMKLLVESQGKVVHMPTSRKGTNAYFTYL